MSAPKRDNASSALTAPNRARLRAISTATLSTALFTRGFTNTVMYGPRPLSPSAPRVVGEAYTMRTIPARHDLDQVAVFSDPEHPQRKGVEECPPGHVLVIDSRGDARAASAGGILVTRLMVRGVAGIVTDGGFRDSADIATLDFPSYHVQPSAPTNLTRHHPVDLNVPIGCGGVAVYPGDVIVGDHDGVIVIPAELANEVTEQAHEMTVFETFVQQQVHAGVSIIGLYPPTHDATLRRFEAWRKQTR